MRDCVLWRFAPGLALVGLVCTHSELASAQAAPPPSAAPAVAPAPAAPPPAPQQPAQAAPPPAAYPAPPGAYQTYPAYPYAQQGTYGAPPGYPPPPPGYAYAYPTAPRPPESVPYEGGAVPQGYHVEERPRRGPVIAGVVITASAYALGLTVASTDNFPNATGWLVVPVVGPWITLAARHQEQDCVPIGSGITSNCVSSDDNNTTRTFLVLDGLTQATGAVLLIYGLASPKKVLARDFVGRLEFTPAQLGKNGFGGFVMGTF